MSMRKPLFVGKTYVFHLETAGEVPVLRYREDANDHFHIAEFARGKYCDEYGGTFAAFDALCPFSIGKVEHFAAFKLLIPLSEREQKRFSQSAVLTLILVEGGAVLKGGAFEDEIPCQTLRHL